MGMPKWANTEVTLTPDKRAKPAKILPEPVEETLTDSKGMTYALS
jgi:hypothetical protein